jgi:hypothetical protein
MEQCAWLTEREKSAEMEQCAWLTERERERRVRKLEQCA